eukprot:1506-Heterococcus_DN1.PRE.1
MTKLSGRCCSCTAAASQTTATSGSDSTDATAVHCLPPQQLLQTIDSVQQADATTHRAWLC